MKIRFVLGAVTMLACAAPYAEAQPMPPPPPPPGRFAPPPPPPPMRGRYLWRGRHYEHRERAYDRFHHPYWRYY